MIKWNKRLSLQLARNYLSLTHHTKKGDRRKVNSHLPCRETEPRREVNLEANCDENNSNSREFSYFQCYALIYRQGEPFYKPCSRLLGSLITDNFTLLSLEPAETKHPVFSWIENSNLLCLYLLKEKQFIQNQCV